MAAQRQSADKLMIRFPDGMRAFVKAEAASNQRSMNAEIVYQLQRAYGLARAATEGRFGDTTSAAASNTGGLASAGNVHHG